MGAKRELLTVANRKKLIDRITGGLVNRKLGTPHQASWELTGAKIRAHPKRTKRGTKLSPAVFGS